MLKDSNHPKCRKLIRGGIFNFEMGTMRRSFKTRFEASCTWNDRTTVEETVETQNLADWGEIQVDERFQAARTIIPEVGTTNPTRRDC